MPAFKRGMARGALWAVGVMAAVSPASVCAVFRESDDSVTYGSSHRPLAAESIALLSVSVALALSMILWVLFRPQVRLSVLVCGVAAASLVLVGLASWAVSYLILRDVMTAQMEELLDRTAAVPAMYLTKELRIGVAAVRTVAASVAVRAMALQRQYPAAHLPLAATAAGLALESDTVELLYYGAPGNGDAYSKDGPYIVSVGMRAVGARPPGPDGIAPVLLGGHMHHGDPIPDFIACDAQNDAAREEFCAAATCNATLLEDMACQKTCAERGTAPSQAAQYCGTFYDQTKGAAPHQRYIKFHAGFDERNGRFVPDPHPSPPGATNVTGLKDYNPTQRPWYHNGTAPVFTDPYAFAFMGNSVFGDHRDPVGIGMTVSVGLYDGGSFRGCVGADFSLVSLRPALWRAAESVGRTSEMFVMDSSGYVIGTTWSQRELAADLGVAEDTVPSVFLSTNPRSRMMSILNPLFDVHNETGGLGALEAMTRRRAILHGSDMVHMSYPIDAVYRQYILVVAMPYSAITADSDHASWVSLLAVFLITIACSGLLFVVVSGCMRPLTAFAWRLAAVSEMRLGEEGDRQPRIAELVTMERAYTLMVLRLAQYKEFLPQTVLDESEDEEDAAAPMMLSKAGTASEEGQNAQPASLSTAAVPAALAAAALPSPNLVSPAPATLSPTPTIPALRMGESHAMADVVRAFSQGTQGTRASLEYTDLSDSGSSRRGHRNPLQGRVSLGDSVHLYGATTVSDLLANSAHYTPKRFNVGLVERKVTLMGIIVSGIREAVRREPFAATNAYAMAVEHVQKCCGKGVVDSFNGDVVVVTFNASKLATEHQANAITSAVTMRDGNRSTTRLAVALATGSASVGNLGCAGLKKFTLIGDVYDAMWEYVHVNRLWAIPVLASEAAFDATPGYDRRRVHMVERQGDETMLCEVLHDLGLAEEEWMYQLEQVGSSPYRKLDSAVGFLFKNDFKAASAALEGGVVEPGSVAGEHAARLRRWVAHAAESGETIAPIRLGMPAVHDIAAMEYINPTKLGSVDMQSHSDHTIGTSCSTKPPDSISLGSCASSRTMTIPTLLTAD